MRFQQEGREHAGEDPAERLAKKMSAAAQRRRKLLGQIDTHRAGKHDNTVKPVISVPTINIGVAAEPILCAVIISRRPGIANTNASVIVSRRPITSIM